MSLLSDILKEVPLSSVLKEKIADLEAKNATLETEVAILKDELHKAKQETTVLRNANEQRDKLIFEIDESAQKILVFLAQSDEFIDREYILQATGLHPTQLSYYLTELLNNDYVDLNTGLYGEDYFYKLAQQGRKYVLSNKLL